MITDNIKFKRWFGKSKAVDLEGNPLEMHHLTDSEFDTFSHDHIRGGASAYHGFGFNFSRSGFGGYGKNDVVVYLRAIKPLTNKRKTIRFDKLYDIIRKADEGEDADNTVVTSYNDRVCQEDRKYQQYLFETVRKILEYAENDLDIYAAVCQGYGGSKKKMIDVWNSYGYDSVIEYDNYNHLPSVIVVFYPNQVKSVKNTLFNKNDDNMFNENKIKFKDHELEKDEQTISVPDGTFGYSHIQETVKKVLNEWVSDFDRVKRSCTFVEQLKRFKVALKKFQDMSFEHFNAETNCTVEEYDEFMKYFGDNLNKYLNYCQGFSFLRKIRTISDLQNAENEHFNFYRLLKNENKELVAKYFGKSYRNGSVRTKIGKRLGKLYELKVREFSDLDWSMRNFFESYPFDKDTDEGARLGYELEYKLGYSGDVLTYNNRMSLQYDNGDIVYYKHRICKGGLSYSYGRVYCTPTPFVDMLGMKFHNWIEKITNSAKSNTEDVEKLKTDVIENYKKMSQEINDTITLNNLVHNLSYDVFGKLVDFDSLPKNKEEDTTNHYYGTIYYKDTIIEKIKEYNILEDIRKFFIGERLAKVKETIENVLKVQLTDNQLMEKKYIKNIVLSELKQLNEDRNKKYY